MLLGKIIQSNSHLDYLCQIYRENEIENPPAAQDFALGRFVSVDLPDGSQMVGVIYNTQLFNPDFGRLGPRLSPQNELEIFSPDYLQERATLVSIAALGTLRSSSSGIQTPPALTPDPDARVHALNDEEIRRFHDVKGQLQMAYAPSLLGQQSPSTPELLIIIVDQLVELFPDKVGLLSLVRDDLLWRARVSPFGGEA
jgi:hypothetical protein